MKSWFVQGSPGRRVTLKRFSNIDGGEGGVSESIYSFIKLGGGFYTTVKEYQYTITGKLSPEAKRKFSLLDGFN